MRVTVYASSSERLAARYHEVAAELGRLVGERGWTLVFGGGRHGLMGTLSRAARAAGAPVVGVILQEFIDKNVHCTETREMISVSDMRSRKRGLDEAGDAYVALPGGLGTLEEITEMLSFRQLGFHRKPVIVLNAFGYWDGLIAQVRRGLEEGFIRPEHAAQLWVAATPADAVAAIEKGY